LKQAGIQHIQGMDSKAPSNSIYLIRGIQCQESPAGKDQKYATAGIGQGLSQTIEKSNSSKTRDSLIGNTIAMFPRFDPKDQDLLSNSPRTNRVVLPPCKIKVKGQTRNIAVSVDRKSIAIDKMSVYGELYPAQTVL
jgi:hypothetical protein